MYHQGEVYFFNLEPALGTEERKIRPCIIVSNDDYNRTFNTVIIVPISSSSKYLESPKYSYSPLFVRIDVAPITGTALIQHLRSIDPKSRIQGHLQLTLDNNIMNRILNPVRDFY